MRRFASSTVDNLGDTSLVKQYRIVPVSEHPIFPGSTTSLGLTKEEYDIAKEVDTVFASVVSNQKVLETGIPNDLISNLEAQTGHRFNRLIGLPQIN